MHLLSTSRVPLPDKNIYLPLLWKDGLLAVMSATQHVPPFFRPLRHAFDSGCLEEGRLAAPSGERQQEMVRRACVIGVK